MRGYQQQVFTLQLSDDISIQYYRVAPKSKPVSFLHIFANYWPIFEIFSLLHSVKNL